jgi:hypothetical protein
MEFRAPEQQMDQARVRTAWAILRVQNPLLESKVEMLDYHHVKFMLVCYSHPSRFNTDFCIVIYP